MYECLYGNSTVDSIIPVAGLVNGYKSMQIRFVREAKPRGKH